MVPGIARLPLTVEFVCMYGLCFSNLGTCEETAMNILHATRGIRGIYLEIRANNTENSEYKRMTLGHF